MMQYVREISLIGEENFQKLRRARAAVFGVGGVGSYAAEALVRAGVGHVTFVDGDGVSLSNLNRQLIALHSTLGRNKAEVMAERARDIDPQGEYIPVPHFYGADTAADFDFTQFDLVADCIDAVPEKVRLITAARSVGVPVVSAMGAGNKTRCEFRAADLEKTRECPLARIMRRELKKAGVTGVVAVYSEEKPLVPDRTSARSGEKFIGSLSYVPSSAGLCLAGEAIRILLSR